MNNTVHGFRKLLTEAFIFAKTSHRCSFTDQENNRPEDKVSAMTYAAACIAKYSAAEVAYWSHPELQTTEIVSLLAQFDTFTQEVLNDFQTNHSRQWVDIEFAQLEERFNRAMGTLEQ